MSTYVGLCVLTGECMNVYMIAYIACVNEKAHGSMEARRCVQVYV